jgi:hypothetical protein
VGGGGSKASCRRKTEPLAPITGRLKPYMRARVGKKKNNTSEGSEGITFSNPAVVGGSR